MKLILTGATGMIGSAVLRRALLKEDIQEIVYLGRRPAKVTHTKLTFIKHDDFTTFPDAVLAQLRGADALIYCLGQTFSQGWKQPKADLELVSVRWPFETLNACSSVSNKPFTFVYTNGVSVERDQNHKYSWPTSGNAAFLRMKGQGENELIRAAQGKDVRLTFAKFGLVFDESSLAGKALAVLPSSMFIGLDHLADFLIYAATKNLDQETWLNADIAKWTPDYP